MLISKWLLSQIAEFEVDLNELITFLDTVGFEVEEVIETKDEFKNIVVGKILEISKHPNADKLKICKVDIGNEILQIVTGASNVYENMIVPVAKIGAIIPSTQDKMKKVKFRGIESFGMLCSEKELSLAEDAAGILDLSKLGIKEDKIGENVSTALNLDTWILDISVMPNRYDCLGALGILREISLLTDVKFKNFEIDINRNNINFEINIENPNECYRYIGASFKNVKILPSDLITAYHLRKLGITPHNNIVDLSNLIMLLTGHPNHTFDKNKIENEITIKRASGEFETFSGDILNLDNDLVITSGNKIVALAGIIGGKNSGIDDDTNEILLELASFNPKVIQSTALRLNINTDSSYRFSKGNDPFSMEYVLKLFIHYIESNNWGNYMGYIDNWPNKFDLPSIEVSNDEVSKFFGIKIDNWQTPLKKLGFEFKSETKIKVPSYRYFDVKLKEDIFEEIARTIGFETFKGSLPKVVDLNDYKNEFFYKKQKIKEILIGLGMYESVTPSLINVDFGELKLKNPASLEMASFRQFITSSLIKSVLYNLNLGNDKIALFEIGKVFFNGKEQEKIGVILAGKKYFGYNENDNWSGADLRKILEELNIDLPYNIDLKQAKIQDRIIKVENYNFIPANDFITLSYYMDSNILIFITYHERYGNIIGFETFLDKIDTKISLPKQLFDYPISTRDISLMVPNNIQFEEIKNELEKTKYLEKYYLFDVYTKWEDKYSLTFKLIFRANKTLKDKDIDKAIKNLLGRLKNKGIVLRGEENE